MPSITSLPSAISITWVLSAFALSLVIIIGGFGLFFEPAGLPLGRREISPSLPSLPPPPLTFNISSLLFSSRSLF
ncbi:hypothetical protein HanIR_Chr06g0257441 [Helianthus annuus]|nr:hypothetical protein HanIR_Chr06g0257441 [Helianthus annuus]